MNWHCTIKLVPILCLAYQIFFSGCGDVEENVTANGINTSYVPFPAKPIPKLTKAEKKLLEHEDFVRIEPGEFQMGSPPDEPGHLDDEIKHVVRITKPFYIGKFEVTVNQWNLLQPPILQRDGNFSLPEGLRELISQLNKEEGAKQKIKPNPLALNPNDRVYTVKTLERILSILQKKLSKTQGGEKAQKAKAPYTKTKLFIKKLEDFIRVRKYLPITDVSYPQAKSFCWRRTEQAWNASTIPKSMVFRLPTEAEWEYACRGGLEGICGLEEGNKLSGMNANINGGKKGYIIGNENYLINQGKLVSSAITPTKYPPNSWGIHDMHGNLYEWCHDYYGPYSTAPERVDPLGPIRGKERVIRGGSFLRTAYECRSASRKSVEPSWRGSEIGFRLVLGYPL